MISISGSRNFLVLLATCILQADAFKSISFGKPDAGAFGKRNGELRGIRQWRNHFKPFRLPSTICALHNSVRMTQSKSESIQKTFIWSTWAIYMYHIFLSDSPCGSNVGEMCGITLPVTMEAINLSINFWFVTPTLFPSIAPTLHPALEGLFNIVIAWGGLFFCFLSDGRKQKVPMLPFIVGTAFLTNVFYLPYLALRQSFARIKAGDVGKEDVDPAALRLAEGRSWPLLMTAVFFASIYWSCFGRDGAVFGDVATRWDALQQMALHTDRLAHSFFIDCLTFWAFQGFLIPDDLRRRGYGDEGRDAKDPLTIATAAARYIPFFGLVFYLLQRPPLRQEYEEEVVIRE